MSKYIINLRPDCKVVQQICAIDKGINIGSRSVGLLDELTDDYVKENFKDLLEGEYQRGLEEGKKAAFGLVADASNAEYQKGFEDGKKFSVGEAIKRAEYDKGLEDAWECAKKLYLNGLSKELFGRYFNAFIQEYSARQAIEMLKAHEQKKDNKIGVGDVVKTYNGITYVVTKATTDGIVVGFEGEGNTCRFALSEVTKTGEHYNINEILGGLSDD